jgi:hypothetical protein
VFEQAAFKVTRDLQAQFFATQAIDDGYAVSNKSRVDLIVVYNALSALQRAGLFR